MSGMCEQGDLNVEDMFTEEQLKIIYSMDCDELDCGFCKAKFGEKIMQYCPKAYADDYRDALRTIKNTQPIINRIINKLRQVK